MTPLVYASDRLKVLERERKALLKEQAKREEQFRCQEEERKVMIEVERKSHQEAQDLLMAQQLDNEFNNVHFGGRKNSPPPTPPKSP